MCKVKGLPYKGSKQAIAKEVVDNILRIKPNTTKVYDLFGGGASIALEFASRGIEVIYNDKDSAICNLLTRLQDPEPFDVDHFVNRKRFNDLRDNSGWICGFARCAYSFGNNGVDYIYSKKDERDKEILHEIVIGQNKLDNIAYFNSKYFVNLSYSMDKREIIAHLKENDLGDLGRFTQFKHLDNIKRIKEIQKMSFLKNITAIHNLSFDEVALDGDREDTIIYLDPPYVGTRKYKESKGLDLESFVKNRNFPIFMSEYTDREIVGFKEVWSKVKRVTINPNDTNSRTATEKLYYAR